MTDEKNPGNGPEATAPKTRKRSAGKPGEDTQAAAPADTEPTRAAGDDPAMSSGSDTPANGDTTAIPDAAAPDQAEQANHADADTMGTEPPPPPPSAQDQPRPGRGIAMVALLLALLLAAAAAFGGWWLYERQQSLEATVTETQAGYASTQQLQEIRSQMRELEDQNRSRVERMTGRVDNLASDHQSHLQTLARMEGAVGSVREDQERNNQRMQRLEALAAATGDEWILSEVDYLFSVARYRARFNRDVDGSIAALREADRLLARLGPDTADERRGLRRAVDALVDVRQPDRGALAQRLTAVIDDVENWRIRQPETRVQSQPMAGQPDADLTSTEGIKTAADRAWEQFKSSLGSLVVVTRDDTPAALVSPQESWFLQQNVQLQLQTARLALLEGETETWRASLEQADQWIAMHFNADDSGVRAARETLQSLKAASIRTEMPDMNELLPRINAQETDT